MFSAVYFLPPQYPRVLLLRQNFSSKTGVPLGKPEGVLVFPKLQSDFWSTTRVMRRLASQAPMMSLLSVGLLQAGELMMDLLEITLLFLKSNLSPSVRQCTVTFWMVKQDCGVYTTCSRSQKVTPFHPYTVPMPLSQQRLVFSSTPKPNFCLKSIKTGTNLASLPLAWKWVSVTKSTKPKAGILPALSLYCSDFVPFLSSYNPVPFTPPSATFFGASPTEFLKQRAPKDPPPPKVWFAQTMEPADEPAQMIELLRALFLSAMSSALGVPSSLSQDRACLA